MSTEDNFMLDDAAEDAKTIAFIRNYLPQEMKERFTDEDLYYFFDLIVRLEQSPQRPMSGRRPRHDGCRRWQDKTIDN